MTEIELLDLLNKKLKEARFTKIEFDISTNPDEKNQKLEELKTLETEIEQINSDVQNIPNKGHSLNAKENMIAQLSAYIQEIDNAPNGYRLTKNQGLIIDNYLFGMIVGDLHRFISTDSFSGISHHYLEYTNNDESSINKTDLKNFLNQEIRTLRNIENSDYVKLRNYISDLENRILEEYIE